MGLAPSTLLFWTAELLTQKLLKQCYVIPIFKSCLHKLYGRHHELVDRYEIYISQLVMYFGCIFSLPRPPPRLDLTRSYLPFVNSWNYCPMFWRVLVTEFFLGCVFVPFSFVTNVACVSGFVILDCLTCLYKPDNI